MTGDQGQTRDILSLALPLSSFVLLRSLPLLWTPLSDLRQTLIFPLLLRRQLSLSHRPRALGLQEGVTGSPWMGSPLYIRKSLPPWASSSHFQDLSSLQEGPLGLTCALAEDEMRDSSIYTREKELDLGMLTATVLP